MYKRALFLHNERAIDVRGRFRMKEGEEEAKKLDS